MGAIDAAAPEPVEVLIGRAGGAVARAAVRMLGGTYGRRVVVVAGKGNNGNDGREAARRLRRRGVRVEVLDVADRAGHTAARRPGDRRRLRHRVPGRVVGADDRGAGPRRRHPIRRRRPDRSGGRPADGRGAHGHLRRPEARSPAPRRRRTRGRSRWPTSASMSARSGRRSWKRPTSPPSCPAGARRPQVAGRGPRGRGLTGDDRRRPPDRRGRLPGRGRLRDPVGAGRRRRPRRRPTEVVRRPLPSEGWADAVLADADRYGALAVGPGSGDGGRDGGRGPSPGRGLARTDRRGRRRPHRAWGPPRPRSPPTVPSPRC